MLLYTPPVIIDRLGSQELLCNSLRRMQKTSMFERYQEAIHRTRLFKSGGLAA
jgi:hypothetical protein